MNINVQCINYDKANSNRGLCEIRHTEDSYNPPIIGHQTLHERLRDIIEDH
jgi:hypothetical protein